MKVSQQEMGLNPNKTKWVIKVVQEIWNITGKWRISKRKPMMLNHGFWLPQLSIPCLTFDLWVGFCKVLASRISLKILFKKSHWDELALTMNSLLRIIGTKSNDLNTIAFENCIEHKMFRIFCLSLPFREIVLCSFLCQAVSICQYHKLFITALGGLEWLSLQGCIFFSVINF